MRQNKNLPGEPAHEGEGGKDNQQGSRAGVSGNGGEMEVIGTDGDKAMDEAGEA